MTGQARDRESGVTLARRLGPLDGAAIVVSNVIGGGIFFVPIVVAGLVSSAGALMALWIAGGVLAFFGAMAYAELAALRPEAGGEYVYLRAAFGPAAAFFSGWTSFVAGFSGAIAVGALALADYVGRFLPAAADRTAFVSLPLPFVSLAVSPQALVAISAIVGLSVVHAYRSGRAVHNILASLKVLLLVVFVAIGLGLGAGSLGNLAETRAVAAPATAWVVALVPIMFTYSGWNAAAYVAEEMRDPGRNVPRALALGTLAVVALYLGLNLLFLYAMPIAELAALPGARLTDVVAERLFGFVAGNALAVFTIVSIAASISAMVWAGPRVYYAMARDGVFLRAAARVHPRFRTPTVAIAAQAVWASLLVLSGDLVQLVTYTGFAVVLFSGAAVAGLFVLRRREPDAARPFRAVGYPTAPAIFVIASAIILAYQLWNEPSTSLAGMAVILAGLPLYGFFRRRGNVGRGEAPPAHVS